jgi:hypothetical protein
MRLRGVEPGLTSGNKKPGDQGRAVLIVGLLRVESAQTGLFPA